MDYHSMWMRVAVDLARTGTAVASPNPAVGAVVIDAHGTLVGKGYHQGPGTSHAEVSALLEAGESANNGTLYVTLEPCSHHGRMPPCVDAIIASKIKTVVAATIDPNALVSGNGFKKLTDAGINVITPILEKEARLLHKSYITWASEGRPYIYVKSAQSLDGKVATRTHHSQWITSPEARDDGHRLRARVDAILVGVNTLIADDPKLTARPGGKTASKQPLKIVVDSDARTPPTSKLFRAPGETLIAVTARAAEKAEKLKARGANIWVGDHSPDDNNARVNIKGLLRYLASMDVTNVLVEGGPTIIGAFWDADLIDEAIIYVAPKLIGGLSARGAWLGRGVDRLDDRPDLVDMNWTDVGPDVKITARIPRPFLLDEAKPLTVPN